MKNRTQKTEECFSCVLVGVVDAIDDLLEQVYKLFEINEQIQNGNDELIDRVVTLDNMDLEDLLEK